MAREDGGGMRKLLIWLPLGLFLAFLALFASGLL
ncbi:MAG TPA: DsbE family thiol:disulfide interchange protein, partial [Sphingobium sp.]|nr:DsbE family thiol:disulfide interchange protein [Sphingobium sp.]